MFLTLNFIVMEELLDALIRRQHENSDWDFYKERQHVENLFYSRFNFFLVFYGVFIAAIVSLFDSELAKDCPLVLGLLFLGIIISLLMQYTLCNIHQTLQIILKLIDGLPAYHSSPIISSLRFRGHTGFIMAFFIPFLCILFSFCILWYCLGDLCEYKMPLFVFSAVLVLLISLYCLRTANYHIPEERLRNVINTASGALAPNAECINVFVTYQRSEKY